MATRPTLRPGAKSKAVIEAKKLTIAHLVKFGQKELAALINTKHGTYGPSAVKGVRYVQKRFKLEVDGIIGPNTWKVLDYARKPKPAVPVLTIVPREVWSARTPRGVQRVTWSKTTPTRVHHTDGAVPTGSGKALIASERQIMRDTQKYHMDTRKYADIAYNFVIMPSGRVYEGRGRAVMGAHTLGHNEDCGIVFAGDYTKRKLTWRQVRAYNLLRRKMGISKGKAYPHSATYSTSCPGSNVTKRLGI